MNVDLSNENNKTRHLFHRLVTQMKIISHYFNQLIKNCCVSSHFIEILTSCQNTKKSQGTFHVAENTVNFSAEPTRRAPARKGSDQDRICESFRKCESWVTLKTSVQPQTRSCYFCCIRHIHKCSLYRMHNRKKVCIKRAAEYAVDAAVDD